MSLTLIAVQLILNLSWLCNFFSLHQRGWAFVNIVIIWLPIVPTRMSFFRSSMVGGSLLVPYLVWVSFATVLHLSIWRLN